MAVVVEWKDGTVDAGPSAASLVELIADSPWNACNPEEMLHLLSDRAWTLTGAAIDPELPLEGFFAELEEAGLCRIVEWAPEARSAGSPTAARSRRLSMRARRERDQI